MQRDYRSTVVRAWQVTGVGEPTDVLRIAEVDPPTPGPGQVRVRVSAAGIGLPDVFMCRGTYPMTPTLPFTPGQEVAGVVTAVGSDVTLPIGSRVMAVTMFFGGSGSFAEECLVSAANAFPIPAGLTDAEAAGFWIPHLTAWCGLVDRGGIEPGDVVAVLGASGGSGSAAVMLAKALGARVIAVAGGPDKVDFCRALGADDCVDHHDGPIAAQLRDLTDGRGVDLVYDPVGGDAAEDAAGALMRGGRLLLIGFASGRWPEIAPPRLVGSNTSMVGVLAAGQTREQLETIHGRLAALVADGGLRSVVQAITFDDLRDELQLMAERAVVGKRAMVW